MEITESVVAAVAVVVVGRLTDFVDKSFVPTCAIFFFLIAEREGRDVFTLGAVAAVAAHRSVCCAARRTIGTSPLASAASTRKSLAPKIPP